MNIRRTHCCSFCGQQGHKLTTCNSNRIREFEAICATQVLQINAQNDFKNWLIQNYIQEQLLIKVFAIKKFRVTSKISFERAIDITTEYIFRVYKNMDEYANQFDNDLTSFIQELLEEESEITESEQLRAIENTLTREMITFIMSMVTIDTDEYNKFQIISTVTTNNNENIKQLCECNICYDEKKINNFVKLGCNHEFCKDCIIKTIKTVHNNKLCCALCREEVTHIKSRTIKIKAEIDKYVV